MRIRLGVLCCLGLAVGLSGCGAIFVADSIRRHVTYDDVVLVRANRTLYKRRNRDGLFAHPSLAAQEVGSIRGDNPKIILFPNYQAAVESGYGFIVDPVSRPDIPYDTHPESAGPYKGDPDQPPVDIKGRPVPLAPEEPQDAAVAETSDTTEEATDSGATDAATPTETAEPAEEATEPEPAHDTDGDTDDADSGESTEEAEAADSDETSAESDADAAGTEESEATPASEAEPAPKPADEGEEEETRAEAPPSAGSDADAHSGGTDADAADGPALDDDAPGPDADAEE
jgi:hypothetical protein